MSNVVPLPVRCEACSGRGRMRVVAVDGQRIDRPNVQTTCPRCDPEVALPLIDLPHRQESPCFT